MRRASILCLALIVSAGYPSLRVDVRAAMDSGAGNAAKGRAIFVKYCAGCHGPKGQGDGYRLFGEKPANLTAPGTKRKYDKDLLKTIHEGKPNMPPWRPRLSNQDSRDVMAYIRALTGKHEG